MVRKEPAMNKLRGGHPAIVAVIGLACFLVMVVGMLWLLKWLLWG